MQKFSATFSVEDNKLRLYVEGNERLDEATYAKVKAAGFSWAPVQKLFVAGRWTPSREDLCIELAGEIFAEESTMAERAVAKAARLDGLRAKNLANADAFQKAAHRIADRMAAGQPILVGHHSERAARKDVQRMKAASERAEKCAEAVQYWGWKAEGAERHANYKHLPAVRERRIATLMTDLRDCQRDLNHGYIVTNLWTKISGMEGEKRTKAVGLYCGAHLNTGTALPYGTYSEFSAGKLTEQEVIDKGLAYGEALMESETASRFINHILNRLSYEREELPPTPLFEGEVTATMLQVFARTQGAHKPEGKKNADGTLTLRSTVPFPCQMGDGLEMTLTGEAWAELMQGCGYVVPAKKSIDPILNFKIPEGQGLTSNIHRGVQTYRQVVMTKAEYDALYEGNRGVRKHSGGGFRFRVAMLKGSHKTVAVFLSDSKVHPAPDGDITSELMEAAA